MNITKEKIKEYLSHKKGMKSVYSVINYFEELGYVTTKANPVCANGTDLTIIKGKNSFRVEVKTIFKSSRVWKVNKVTRKQDDLVAIVFPKTGYVHVDTMLTHLRECSKSGFRCMNKLGKLYE